MYLDAIITKVDNTFRAEILWASKPDTRVIVMDTKIFNRRLGGYAQGMKLRVQIHLTPVGRRVIRYVYGEWKDPIPTDYGHIFPAKTPAPRKTRVSKPKGVGISTPVVQKKPKSTTKEMIVNQTNQSAPAATETFFVNQESRLVFNHAFQMSKNKPERAIKIMMVGGSGYGKTDLPKEFARRIGYRYVRMNCPSVRDPEEWFGFREAKEGSTLFVRSQFAKEIEAGNVVVVLDEFNRLEPWLHNCLFPLLDQDGFTVVHDELFSIGKNVIVVATINTGFRYTGTFELDEALFNRFDFTLEVGPMPEEEEVKVLMGRTGIALNLATEITKMANILRQAEVICSTRTSLLVANMVQSGMLLREAFESAVIKRIPGLDNPLRKQVVDLVNVRFGVLKERYLQGDVFGNVVQELASEQEETKATPVTGSFLFLRYKPDNNSSHIVLIKYLRSLAIQSVDGTVGLGLKEAKDLVDAMIAGKEATLYFPTELSYEQKQEIGQALKGYSCTGRISSKGV